MTGESFLPGNVAGGNCLGEDSGVLDGMVARERKSYHDSDGSMAGSIPERGNVIV
jgi:hypothetical protein